jgi:tripartite-type tricarboxylate transporter receptor subunit TctC
MKHCASSRRQLLVAATIAALSWMPLASQAQNFPARQVRLVVPFPPGGPVDTVARTVAQKLGETWGQSVIVDNRAGAGGQVGAEHAAKAAADGYTVFVCSIHHTVLPALKPKLPYDIERDFLPLTFGARFPIVLVTHPSVEAKTVAELTALAKRQPGKLAYASSGNGGGTHLAGELFDLQAGTRLLHVPYKGSAPAMSDVLGGQVQMMFADAPTALPQVRGGKVRALGVAQAQRSELLPSVPTFAEAGLAGYEAYSWAGFVVPAGTPKDIAARLSQDIAKALAQPDVKARLHDAGAEAAPGTPEQFARFINDEIAKWGKVVKAGNIQAD